MQFRGYSIRKNMKTTSYVITGLILSLMLLGNNDSFSDEKGGISLKIAKSVSLKKDEIMNFIPALELKNGSSVEILVFYYTESVETFTYTEDENLSHDTRSGGIEALVKIKQNGRLERAVFIKAKGGGKNEILKNFSIRLKSMIEKQ